jgi:hypothetical protein
LAASLASLVPAKLTIVFIVWSNVPSGPVSNPRSRVDQSDAGGCVRIEPIVTVAMAARQF